MRSVSSPALIETAVGLYGAWLITQGTVHLVTTSLAWFFNHGMSLQANLTYSLPTILIGLGLCTLRKRIRRFIAPASTSSDILPQWLVATAAACVGFYFFGNGLVDAFCSTQIAPGQATPDTYLLYRGITQCVVGSVLFMASNNLARIWSKLEA